MRLNLNIPYARNISLGKRIHRLASSPMLKRELSSDAIPASLKKSRIPRPFSPIKVATKGAASAVDLNPPFSQLMKLVSQTKIPSLARGKSVVFWMRMGDLRINDNRALSRASKRAQDQGIPLLVLFVISPQDYIAHDTGARKIDFMLRNLRVLKDSLGSLKIPLYTAVQDRRKSIPSFVSDFCNKYGARYLYANLEYEVDELRRDIEVFNLGLLNGFQLCLEHDKCLVDPGVLLTNQGRAYAVYSPYQRKWLTTVNSKLSYYLEDCQTPAANQDDIETSELFSPLFNQQIPVLHRFKLEEDDREKMEEVWPAGETAASQILHRFLHTKSRSLQLGAVNPLAPGFQECTKHNRAAKYGAQRDRTDSDTTSRLSPYLSSGVISIRACIRAAMVSLKTDKVEGDKSSGIGRWVQELAWRDFYTNILASFPRVSMGRPYLEKFSSVVWETHQAPPESGAKKAENEDNDGDILKKWKIGMTGVPIVDAAMRCINGMGWVHNRVRMITAMYLTKDLMIDWRVGERYFMEKLIDGDLSSNNGGWQWCASTGVDPCPYFRVFNPYSQSLKADPTGDFIRYWVPELNKLYGPDLHNPSSSIADKLGYPRPIIPHNEARERAIRRYKNPGEA